MYCRYCGKENRESSKFCRFCGKEIQKSVTNMSNIDFEKANICPNCGAEIKIMSKFCGVCGTPIRNQKVDITTNIIQEDLYKAKNRKSNSIRPLIIFSFIIVICIGALFLLSNYNNKQLNNSWDSDEIYNIETDGIQKHQKGKEYEVDYSNVLEDKNEGNSYEINIIESEINCESLVWKQEYKIENNKTIQLDLNGDGNLDFIEVGMDTPNGSKVLVIVNNLGFNLLDVSTLYGTSSLFEEYGELKENCYIQIRFIDFDDDGKMEIIVAVGDGLINLNASIFKYTEENDFLFYEEIGSVEGQEKIYITKDKTIIVPYGSQGLYKEYKFDNDKLTEVN